MKRIISLLILLLVMVTWNSAFAGDGPEVINVPLGPNQEILFTLEDPEFGATGNILDLAYDRVSKQLYIFTNDKFEYLSSSQFTYSLETEKLCKPSYPLLSEYRRIGIEFEANETWSLEYNENSGHVRLNNFDTGLVESNFRVDAMGFEVQGNQVIYWNSSRVSYNNSIVLGETQPINGDEQIGSIFFEDVSCINGYDFSPNGEEIIFAGSSSDEPDQKSLSDIYVYKMNVEDTSKIERFKVLSENNLQYARVSDLYTTEDHIVVLYRDFAESKGYIERYTYDGTRVDGVVTNRCIKKITEGPNDSTIYIQARYPEEESKDRKGYSVMEVIQVNWDGKDATGPKHVIQEKTRVGHTLARFTDSQFGLLRMEEPETGIVDYKAPIRSKENLVKLQIPYCDIKAKLESGARNLVVEYQGQTLSFPMDLFKCDDMLASMPCQDDATIEIIMYTDEAGTVTYDVQLFVVEQVNAMTRVVHRKTIQ
jgi:hypothetical protein